MNPTRTPDLYAILFNFNYDDDEFIALSKKVRVEDEDFDVVYYGIFDPIYYIWKSDGYWDQIPQRAYEPGDDLIFAFCDTSEPRRTQTCIATIHFQQAIAPFDDKVTAAISMAKTEQYELKTSADNSLHTFALGWRLLQVVPELPPAPPILGYEVESVGKYDYAITLLALDEKGHSKRFWHDPTMCVGGACSG